MTAPNKGKAMDWLRWHHGTCTDPKWRVVASRASHAMSRRVTVSEVLSVWACMTECASQASPRGRLLGWCHEDVAAGLDLDEALVSAVYDAMQGKTLDGDRLMAWEKRQPQREREDPDAAERKRAQRERERLAREAAEAAERDSHATSRQDTHREEESRGDSSVGEIEGVGSRAREDEAAPPPTRAGLAAKALIAAGVVHVNPSHEKLRRLVEAGVTPKEFGDAGAEAIAKGKGNLNYVCAMIESRRAEAVAAGAVPAGKPAPKPASHGKYKPPPPESPESAYRVEVQLCDQMLELGTITPAQHTERVDEARRRMEARAGPERAPAPPPTPHATH